MIERTFRYTITDDKLIERVIDDCNVAINHMTLSQDTSLPIHNANSNVYMIIVRGQMTIGLDGEAPNVHGAGTILAVPFQSRMNVTNKCPEPLEFFVVKAPNPKDMPAV